MLSFIQCAIFKAQLKFRELLTKEDGEVNIVAIVVLIGIAVVLAVIFKDAIKGLITDLLNAIKGKATTAIES